MNQLLVIGAIAILIIGCNEEGTPAERKLDSVQLELDAPAKKVDTTLNKPTDSLKIKAQNLRDKVKENWRNAKDSSIKKDSVQL